ncbi:16485_t:CDS:2, partial [Funneliformis geosporum]
DVMLLPTGYNSDQPPSSEKFCDYDQCSILSDTESSQQIIKRNIGRFTYFERKNDGITDEDNDIFEDEI